MVATYNVDAHGRSLPPAVPISFATPFAPGELPGVEWADSAENVHVGWRVWLEMIEKIT